MRAPLAWYSISEVPHAIGIDEWEFTRRGKCTFVTQVLLQIYNTPVQSVEFWAEKAARLEPRISGIGKAVATEHCERTFQSAKHGTGAGTRTEEKIEVRKLAATLS